MTRIIELFITVLGFIPLLFCTKEFYQNMINEMKHWNKHIVHKQFNSNLHLYSYLITHYKEYCTLYQYRFSQYGNILLKIWVKLALVFIPKQSSLFVTNKNIGWNLIIQHGFSTVISAKKIGSNCWINQQVTIGYSFDENPPTIGNGCIICAGAKVIGDITIGDNAIIGANAVVVHDVFENQIVGGIPAKVIGINTEHIMYEGK